LSPAQLDQLRNLTRDIPETDRVTQVGTNGAFELSVPMHTNDVALVTLKKLAK
jgi:xylan 1,4-beta-xylosidase